ncbi:ABC-2 family transporter protein [Nocardioides sp. SYSU D00038]|uniref:ABC-2 family transporter protein n=1 Tax=Nocardioides sp. SYSU D00038 TaxID=2812554 RepID=UPI00196790E1|nr:ABC-2 family transporter protein [Nocardioides sp. SYSU D00038]
MIRRTAAVIVARFRRRYYEWSDSRWFLGSLVANETVLPLLGFFVWQSLRPSEGDVDLYFYFLIWTSIATASYEHHSVSNRIYDGSLAQDLLVPGYPPTLYFADNLALRGWLLALSAPFLIPLGILIGGFTFKQLILFLPAVTFAAVIRFLLGWCVALLAFWTGRAASIAGLVNALNFTLGGVALPLMFVESPWSDVLVALPFYCSLGLPASIADGSGSLAQGLQFQLLWTIALGAAAFLLWKIGVRRFDAVGG